jgi:hypothetical protein
METTKTIHIHNPSIFSTVSSKKQRNLSNASSSQRKQFTYKNRMKESHTNERDKERLLKILMKRQEQNFRNTQKQSVTLPPTISSPSIPNELHDSIDYLLDLSDKYHEIQSEHSPPLSSSQEYATNQNVSLQLPETFEDIIPSTTPIVLHPPPKYGCLKGGKNPTYREYKQRLKEKLVGNTVYFDPPPPLSQPYGGMGKQEVETPTDFPLKNEIMESKKEDEQISFQEVDTTTNMNTNQNTYASCLYDKETLRKHKVPLRQKKTVRRTFLVGKHTKKANVSVLLSNRTLRRQVNTKKQSLQEASISDIKRFLIRRGLLKAGSSAPISILRQLYEDANMTHGEVYNHNKDIMLHNFFHTNVV